LASFFALLALSPLGARAAITYVGSDAEYFASSAATHTKAFTATGGADSLLVVMAYTGDQANQVTGATYNGEAMIERGSGCDSSLDYCWTVLTLAAPDAGSHDVVVSYSPNADSSIHIHEYAGVGAFDTFWSADQTAGGGALDQSITVSATDSLLVYSCRHTGGTCDTPTSGETEREDDTFGGSGSKLSVAAGTYHFTMASVAPQRLYLGGAIFSPATEAATGTEATASGTNTAVYQAELQNFIHGWAVLLLALGLGLTAGWHLWKG